MLYDNTTVFGSWTNVYQMASLSEQYDNRIVNNVTIAMPHPGIVAAAIEASKSTGNRVILTNDLLRK